MSITQKDIFAASAIKPKQPSYVNTGPAVPVVKGTNLTPQFFENAGIDPASIVSAGITAHTGCAQNEPLRQYVNEERVNDMPKALIAAGAKPLTLNAA